MRRLADQVPALGEGRRRTVITSTGWRGALLIGLAATVSGTLAATVALTGPADASPAHHNARYTATANNEKDSLPASGSEAGEAGYCLHR